MQTTYELEHTLWEGRTSVVHKGVHRKTGEDVAIKTYSRSGGVVRIFGISRQQNQRKHACLEEAAGTCNSQQMHFQNTTHAISGMVQRYDVTCMEAITQLVCTEACCFATFVGHFD